MKESIVFFFSLCNVFRKIVFITSRITTDENMPFVLGYADLFCLFPTICPSFLIILRRVIMSLDLE